MKITSKQIFIFTENFPYGSGEGFLESEFNFINQKANVVLFPLNHHGLHKRSFVDERLVNNCSNNNLENAPITLKLIFSCIKIILFEFFNSGKKFAVIKRSRWLFAMLRKANVLADKIQQFENQNPKQIVYYSYWMNDWALALALLKKRGAIDSFIFRVLGYDIYDERHPNNYLPFRYFIYSQCKNVFAVSKTSMSYIKGKGMFEDKIKYAYLGTVDFGLSPSVDNGSFLIVSCSRLIPLKRNILIPKILKECNENITWIHIGSGPELENLLSEAKSLPKNVTFKNLPHFPSHHDLINFYQENAIDLFLHVSESEGLGVVHLEALSFGIPVFTTKVGGASEFINDLNGKLFDVEFDPKSVANLIKNQISKGKVNKTTREIIKATWASEFEANRVYEKYYQEILN